MNKTENKVINEVLRELEDINTELIKKEHLYDIKKHSYKIRLLNLKYSTEYQKYKTIKEKEERAEMALYDVKQELLIIKLELMDAERKKEELELKLKLLTRDI